MQPTEAKHKKNVEVDPWRKIQFCNACLHRLTCSTTHLHCVVLLLAKWIKIYLVTQGREGKAIRVSMTFDLFCCFAGQLPWCWEGGMAEQGRLYITYNMNFRFPNPSNKVKFVSSSKLCLEFVTLCVCAAVVFQKIGKQQTDATRDMYSLPTSSYAVDSLVQKADL